VLGNVTASYALLGAATLLIDPEAKGLTFWNTVDSAAVADRVTYGGYDIAGGHRAVAISAEEVLVAGTRKSCRVGFRSVQRRNRKTGNLYDVR